MKPMSKNSREAVSALIAAMYADWLNELPENEFRQECKRFDRETHLLSAANCLLAMKYELAAQR
ncbi:MAG: hypothetical protein PHQ02_09010 [Candidatus Riflebacteria bacterium]|nr:hypothetical protein [Candidatus Riflebacteria bacterium]